MSLSPSNPFGEIPDSPISSQGEIVRAELASPGRPDPGERLSILHLMVWTAGSAVILAFYRQSLDNQPQPLEPLDPPWLQAASVILISPLQGAGVAAVALAAWRRFRGERPFPKEPGHWLLFIAGVIALLTWPAYLITRELSRGGPDAAYILMYRLPMLVVFVVLAVYAIAQMPTEGRWRRMFQIWVIANILPLLFLCVMFVNSPSYRWLRLPDVCIGLVLPLAFLVTGILDKASGVKRDNLHWAGVVCRVAYAGQAVIEIVRMIVWPV